MTLWGSEFCSKFDNLRIGQLLAVKGAIVSDYGGKSLNAADDHAQIYTDLEHPDVAKLQRWYNENKGNADFNSLTAKREPRDNTQADRTEGKASNVNLVAEINEVLQNENDTDNAHFFFLNGFLARIKNTDNLYYPACPGENCRRKVVEESTGYRCENCQKTYMTFNPTYMITAKISDFTESIWVNFARE